MELKTKFRIKSNPYPDEKLWDSGWRVSLWFRLGNLLWVTKYQDTNK